MIRTVQHFFRTPAGTALAYAAFLGCFVFLILRHGQSIRLLRWGVVWWIFAGAALTVAALCCQGVLNAVLFGSIRQRIAFLDGLRLSLLNTMGNFLPFAAGFFARGVMLKDAFGIGYRTYTALVIYSIALHLTVVGICGIVALLLLNSASLPLLLGFVVMTAAPLIATWAAQRIPRLGRFSEDATRRFAEILFPVSGLSLVFVMLSAVRFTMAFQILQLPQPAAGVLLLTSGSMLARLVSLTPGAIGVTELIVAALTHATAVNTEVAVLAVGLDRLIVMLTTFTTAGVVFGAKFGARVSVQGENEQ